MSQNVNIEGLKAGAAGIENSNPYEPGTEEYKSWGEGYISGANAGEYPVSTDMVRIWNE